MSFAPRAAVEVSLELADPGALRPRRQVGGARRDSSPMILPGPSRTIIVEPIERPAQPQRAPATEPERDPAPDPAPDAPPDPDREREPATTP